MHDKGLQMSTPTNSTIVLTRTFDAPRRLVWEATFTPDRMRRWMVPPPGLTMTVCECDARTGGALSIAWKNDDADPVMTLRGEFTDVIDQERAVHTETMALGSGEVIGTLTETHEFAERDDVTTMRITQVYESTEARDGAIESGMDEGMEECYRRLEALIARSA